jgi:hypothetical protein
MTMNCRGCQADGAFGGATCEPGALSGGTERGAMSHWDPYILG